MHIFIDESGIFAPLTNNRASVVAALVVPTSKKARLIRNFSELSKNWPKEKGEVKGRLLDENQIAQTVALLEAHDVIVEMNAIDAALQTEPDLRQIKANMTKIIEGWVKPGHPLKEQITQIAEAYEKTSLQLFTQAYLMQTLVYRVIQHSISYYARRIPKELSHFHWVFDGKDKDVTQFEEAWSTTIFASIDYQSHEKPFDLLVGGDYTYLRRFISSNETEIARANKNKFEEDDLVIFRLKLLLGESFKFADSINQVGLQLVDILASAVCRAFNGNLKPEGWEGIGRLMVQRELQCIPFIIPTDGHGVFGQPYRINDPFAPVVNKLSSNNKSILRDEQTEKVLRKRNRKRQV